MSRMFRIVRILDVRTVIINAGSRDGVDDSSRFSVVGESENIIDNVTGEVLGTIEASRASLRPWDIMEKMTVCISDESIFDMTVLLRGLANLTSAPLNVEASDISPLTFRRKIRVGDEVELMKIAEEESTPKPKLLPAPALEEKGKEAD